MTQPNSGLRGTLREVWGARELLLQLVRRDMTIRYKQAVMGLAWALFMPSLVLLSGVLVRLALARVSGQPLEPGVLGSVAIKALPWAFFTGAVGFGTSSLLANAGLITKIYFPREVLPASAVTAQLVDSSIGALALLPFLPALGATWSPALLWVPLLLMLLIGFTLAAALFLSCANLFFRDVKYIVQVLLTFGIFVTPVFFEPAMFGPRIARWVMLNPIAPLLEGLRLAVIEGHSLLVPLSGENLWRPAWLLYSAAWAVFGLLLALRYFRRSASKFAEYA